ncbi:hypothetical protein ACO2Q2_17115 [Dyella sp. KRB-257]|uniref:hypothetical protein n=1 Tax=Dyella sp. KRB-257 TaxID=3400915 RepID=UPI003C07D9ED
MTGTTLDLRRALADKPRELPPLEFDLTGCAAMISWIKPHTDAIREAADKAEKARKAEQGRNTP